MAEEDPGEEGKGDGDGPLRAGLLAAIAADAICVVVFGDLLALAHHPVKGSLANDGDAAFHDRGSLRSIPVLLHMSPYYSGAGERAKAKH